MVKSYPRRAIRRPTMPAGIDHAILHGFIENDAVYQDNMKLALARRQQGKISTDQFASIRRDLIHRAMYRHVRSIGLPLALVPRFEAIVR
jgi:hypothetical protein